MNFTFGSDPEFFLEDTCRIINAIGIVRSPKHNPSVVDGHSFYYDNVLAECNIKPGNNEQEVIDNFRQCFQTYADIVKPFKLLPKSFYEFGAKFIHSDAYVVGCKEEWCAYNLKPIDNTEAVNIIKKTEKRCAGGHIHIGCDLLKNEFNRIAMVKALDLFLAIPLLYYEPTDDIQSRRQIYGKAGRYRRPIYGLEYRTLSNYWLISPTLTRWVYRVCSYALAFVKSKLPLASYDENELRHAINTCDFNITDKFLPMAKAYLPFQLPERVKDNFYYEWNIQ